MPCMIPPAPGACPPPSAERPAARVRAAEFPFAPALVLADEPPLVHVHVAAFPLVPVLADEPLLVRGHDAGHHIVHAHGVAPPLLAVVSPDPAPLVPCAAVRPAVGLPSPP